MAFNPSYSPVSPYGFTPIIGRFMVYYVHRPVPPHELDVVITLDQRYENRPDLLANDIYGDADMYWIIAVRNGLQDPVYDFKAGELYTITHPSFARTLV